MKSPTKVSISNRVLAILRLTAPPEIMKPALDVLKLLAIEEPPKFSI